MSDEELADRLNTDADTVRNTIRELEEENIIRGYRAVIDESIIPETHVRALIEVKVVPQREGGFDKIAKRISKFDEVSSVYLVSGGYDLELEVQGENLQRVASFVSSKLSTIEGVTSTVTHFLLKKYKVSGKLLHDGDEYERLKVAP